MRWICVLAVVFFAVGCGRDHKLPDAPGKTRHKIRKADKAAQHRQGALLRVAVVASARKLVGSNQVRVSGKTYRSDCSGLVGGVFSAHGVELKHSPNPTPRQSAAQSMYLGASEHYKVYRNEITAGSVNPHYINPRQGLDRLQKLMDEYCGGVTVNYMTNDKLLNIGLKKLKIFEEDLEKIAAENIHELLRAWELKHRHRTSECVMQHTLFRKETRWPGYYYRGDALKLDDENWHVLTVSRRDPETGEYTLEKAPCYHLIGEGEEQVA